MSLWFDFQTNDARVTHKWTHYFQAYENHFSRFRGQSVTILEIGCGAGGSLQMWKRYFGPHAQIVGIDITEGCASFEEDQIAVRIGSQSDTAFLDALLAEFGPFDIVLDDGSHRMDDISTTFAHLYPTLPLTGVYMVEDLHTAYRPSFGGGLGEPASFIEISKGLIDELNADWTGGALAPTQFTRTTTSMHYYDSVLAFERGRHRPGVSQATGGRPAG
jgi:hypothetical protein